MNHPKFEKTFSSAPLLMVLARISTTPFPELLAGEPLVKLKLKMSELGFPISDTLDPRVVENDEVGVKSWIFRDPLNIRAVIFASDALIVADTQYGNFDTFSDLISKLMGVFSDGPLVNETYAKSLALRYFNGFEAPSLPSKLVNESIAGMNTEFLPTSHYHHRYNFWCVTENGGRLVVDLDTVHAHQLIPADVNMIGLRLDVELDRALDYIRLDIYEDVELKTFEKLNPDSILPSMKHMRSNIKNAFLSTTSDDAHLLWGADDGS